MARNLEELAQEAMKLSPPQRASLAHKLIASLDEPVDENAEAEWLAVIDRRLAEIKQGKVKGRPIEDVIRDLRAKAQ